MRRGWELGTEDVLNFETAIMCTNNVIFMNLSHKILYLAVA